MYIPEDMLDLLEYLDSHQKGVYLMANGSDLINRIQRRQVDAKTLVDLSGLSELNYVRKEDRIIRIGALTTVADIASSPVMDAHYDVFREVQAKFGGPSITNMATIGGNICAASSSEDFLPTLLVLDAFVRLRSKQGERIVRLEDFLKGKRMLDLRPNEILVETFFNEIDDDSACAFEKMGMRNSMIIAFVSSAVYVNVSKDSGVAREIRIAFNRVSGKIPARAKHTEDKLRGKKPSVQVIHESLLMLNSELQLSSDFRASRDYRTHVAGVLFRRALSKCLHRLTGVNVVV